MERARRQWELEHADMEQQAAGGSTGSIAGATGAPGAGAGAGTGQTGGIPGQGGGAAIVSGANGMNHISAAPPAGTAATIDAVDGIPGFALVRKIAAKDLRDDISHCGIFTHATIFDFSGMQQLAFSLLLSAPS